MDYSKASASSRSQAFGKGNASNVEYPSSGSDSKSNFNFASRLRVPASQKSTSVFPGSRQDKKRKPDKSDKSDKLGGNKNKNVQKGGLSYDHNKILLELMPEFGGMDFTHDFAKLLTSVTDKPTLEIIKKMYTAMYESSSTDLSNMIDDMFPANPDIRKLLKKLARHVNNGDYSEKNFNDSIRDFIRDENLQGEQVFSIKFVEINLKRPETNKFFKTVEILQLLGEQECLFQCITSDKNKGIQSPTDGNIYKTFVAIDMSGLPMSKKSTAEVMFKNLVNFADNSISLKEPSGFFTDMEDAAQEVSINGSDFIFKVKRITSDMSDHVIRVFKYHTYEYPPGDFDPKSSEISYENLLNTDQFETLFRNQQINPENPENIQHLKNTFQAWFNILQPDPRKHLIVDTITPNINADQKPNINADQKYTLTLKLRRIPGQVQPSPHTITIVPKIGSRSNISDGVKFLLTAKSNTNILTNGQYGDLFKLAKVYYDNISENNREAAEVVAKANTTTNKKITIDGKEYYIYLLALCIYAIKMAGDLMQVLYINLLNEDARIHDKQLSVSGTDKNVQAMMRILAIFRIILEFMSQNTFFFSTNLGYNPGDKYEAVTETQTLQKISITEGSNNVLTGSDSTFTTTIPEINKKNPTIIIKQNAGAMRQLFFLLCKIEPNFIPSFNDDIFVENLNKNYWLAFYIYGNDPNSMDTKIVQLNQKKTKINTTKQQLAVKLNTGYLSSQDLYIDNIIAENNRNEKEFIKSILLNSYALLVLMEDNDVKSTLKLEVIVKISMIIFRHIVLYKNYIETLEILFDNELKDIRNYLREFWFEFIDKLYRDPQIQLNSRKQLDNAKRQLEQEKNEEQPVALVVAAANPKPPAIANVDEYIRDSEISNIDLFDKTNQELQNSESAYEDILEIREKAQTDNNYWDNRYRNDRQAAVNTLDALETELFNIDNEIKKNDINEYNNYIARLKAPQSQAVSAVVSGDEMDQGDQKGVSSDFPLAATTNEENKGMDQGDQTGVSLDLLLPAATNEEDEEDVVMGAVDAEVEDPKDRLDQLTNIDAVNIGYMIDCIDRLRNNINPERNFSPEENTEILAMLLDITTCSRCINIYIPDKIKEYFLDEEDEEDKLDYFKLLSDNKSSISINKIIDLLLLDDAHNGGEPSKLKQSMNKLFTNINGTYTTNMIEEYVKSVGKDKNPSKSLQMFLKKNKAFTDQIENTTKKLQEVIDSELIESVKNAFLNSKDYLQQLSKKRKTVSAQVSKFVTETLAPKIDIVTRAIETEIMIDVEKNNFMDQSADINIRRKAAIYLSNISSTRDSVIKSASNIGSFVEQKIKDQNLARARFSGADTITESNILGVEARASKGGLPLEDFFNAFSYETTSLGMVQGKFSEAILLSENYSQSLPMMSEVLPPEETTISETRLEQMKQWNEYLIILELLKKLSPKLSDAQYQKYIDGIQDNMNKVIISSFRKDGDILKKLLIELSNLNLKNLEDILRKELKNKKFSEKVEDLIEDIKDAVKGTAKTVSKKAKATANDLLTMVSNAVPVVFKTEKQRLAAEAKQQAKQQADAEKARKKEEKQVQEKKAAYDKETKGLNKDLKDLQKKGEGIASGITKRITTEQRLSNLNKQVLLNQLTDLNANLISSDNVLTKKLDEIMIFTGQLIIPQIVYDASQLTEYPIKDNIKHATGQSIPISKLLASFAAGGTKAIKRKTHKKKNIHVKRQTHRINTKKPKRKTTIKHKKVNKKKYTKENR